MALEIKTSDIRKAIHEAYTTADQWEDEIKIFMDGIKSGDFIEFGDKSIGVQWRRGSSANDPRFIIFEYGDGRLRDDHFYVQHSRRLTDDELKDIRDVMVRMGMVDKHEFDMEYCLNYDPKIYDSKIIKTSDIRKLVKEAMYKKLPGDDEEFPKFMGRRPKSIKARIERIHKRCNEYGLSSQKFHDDAWAAVGFYKRVIESLGYEVEIWVENGGYRDYDPQDHMPRSKQYEIRITADDGMVIEGYIKCMAAGSVQGPFDAYDTMMSLWPKPKRSYNEAVKTSDLRNLIRESLRTKLNESEMMISGFEGDESLREYAYNSAMDLANRTEKWIIAPGSCGDGQSTEGEDDMALKENLEDGQELSIDCDFSYHTVYYETTDNYEDEDWQVSDITVSMDGDKGYCFFHLDENDPLSQMLMDKIEFTPEELRDCPYYSAYEQAQDEREDAELDRWECARDEY